MNKLSASYHYTVDLRNNVKLESLRSTPMKTSTDSPSYYSQGWGIQLYDDCSPSEISNGRPHWGKSSSSVKRQQMRETLSALGHKWYVYETPLPTADVFPSSLLTTEMIGVDAPKGSINPGVTMTSTTCSSLSEAGLELPTVSKVNSPTASTLFSVGVRSPATDCSIKKSSGMYLNGREVYCPDSPGAIQNHWFIDDMVTCPTMGDVDGETHFL